MSYFVIALCASALWAISNHIDKYLIRRYAKQLGIGTLVMFSAVIGVPIAAAILLFGVNVLGTSWQSALLMVGSGALFVIGLIPYFLVVQHEDASTVAPAFQAIPIFGFILGSAFLHEQLTGNQILGGVIIILAAMSFMYEPASRRIRLKPLLQLLLAAFIWALTNFLFKFVAIESSFWVTSFWQYVGYAAAGAILLVVPMYRRDFALALRANSLAILTLNAVNETINAGGVLLMATATLMAPLALVQLANGFNPVFTFAFGIILTTLLPRLGREDISRPTLLRKVAALAVLLLGVYLINR